MSENLKLNLISRLKHVSDNRVAQRLWSELVASYGMDKHMAIELLSWSKNSYVVNKAYNILNSLYELSAFDLVHILRDGPQNDKLRTKLMERLDDLRAKENPSHITTIEGKQFVSLDYLKEKFGKNVENDLK